MEYVVYLTLFSWHIDHCFLADLAEAVEKATLPVNLDSRVVQLVKLV